MPEIYDDTPVEESGGRREARPGARPDRPVPPGLQRAYDRLAAAKKSNDPDERQAAMNEVANARRAAREAAQASGERTGFVSVN